AHRLDDPFQILLPLRLALGDRVGPADVAAVERRDLQAPKRAPDRRFEPFQPLVLWTDPGQMLHGARPASLAALRGPELPTDPLGPRPVGMAVRSRQLPPPERPPGGR